MSYSPEFINSLVAQHTALARRDLLADGLPAELSQSGVDLSQEQQLAHVLAFQRLLRGGCGPRQAGTLLAKGIDSASRLAAMTTEDLISHLTPSKAEAGETPTGVETAAAGEAGIETIHQMSAVRHTQMVLRYLEELQEAEPCLAATRFQGRTAWSPDTLTLPAAGRVDMSALPAADPLELVTDSKVPPGRYSAFSPVAYFHALRLLRKNYLSTGSGELAFEKRRQDVEDLFKEGDEPHADDPIPHLERVNAVLETQISKDPAAIYPKLAAALYPFNLPFDLPRTRIRHCLDSFGTDLATLYRAFAKVADPAHAAREMLGWPKDEFDCLTQEEIGKTGLQKRWGLPENENGDDPVTALAPLKEFLPRSGLTLETLQELLFQNLHPEEKKAGVAAGFFINSLIMADRPYLDTDQGVLKLRPSSTNILSDITRENLDRLHRFLRTAHRLGWTYAELDGVLVSACNNTLDENAVPILAGVRYLQSRLNVPLDALCGLWSSPRWQGMGNKPVFRFDDLFNRTFNNALARDYKTYILPAEDYRDIYGKLYGLEEYKVDDRCHARLASSLGIDKTDVQRIEKHLKDKPGFKSPETNKPLAPSTLALFFSFAHLPRILGLSVEDFLGLLGLLGNDNAFTTYNPFPVVAGAAPQALKSYEILCGDSDGKKDIPAILWLIDLLANIADWMKAEGLSVPILRYLCRGDTSPSVQPAVSAAQIESLANNLLQRFQPLRVTFELIAPVLESREEAKKYFDQLRKENKYVDEYGIIIDKNPELTPKNDNSEKIKQYIALLADRQAQTVFAGLDALFDMPDDLVQTAAHTAYRLVKNAALSTDQEFVQFLIKPLFETPKKPGEHGWRTGEPLKFWNHWQRLVTMIRLLGLGGAEAAAIFLHRDRFHIGGFDTTSTSTSLSVAHLKTCTDLRRCAASLGGPERPLIGFTKINEEAAIVPTLVDITGWPKDDIPRLQKQVFEKPDKVNFRDILRLETCFRLAQRLGATPSTLRDKVFKPLWGENGDANGDFKAREEVATLALGLLKGKAGPDAQAEVESALERALHRDKRDPLTGYVLHSLSSKLPTATKRGLYHHLLIDVEMGEEAMTSRLAEAINCLQLYIDRCRMGLEKGITVAPTLEKAWPMLKSYRLWEAWQRLFLYPENYIAPELRDGRSPQFQTLEQRLQQSDIDDANVEAAYREYLDGFSELANLKIAGACAYHDPSTAKDDRCLALFGHTHTEPRRFYYRTATFSGNMPSVLWEPWEEVQLEPGVEQVFPIQAFGKLFVFWVVLEQEKTVEKVGDPPKDEFIYKNTASLRYVFRNAQGGWSQPQNLGNSKNLGIAEKQEDAWKSIFLAYQNKGEDDKNNYLYVFYCRESTKTEPRARYKFLDRLNSELDVTDNISATHPGAWWDNSLPTVNGNSVLTSSVPPNLLTVANQPDWLLFSVYGSTLLIKPNKILLPLNAALHIPILPEYLTDKTSHVLAVKKNGWWHLDAPNIIDFSNHEITMEAWIFPYENEYTQPIFFLFNSEDRKQAALFFLDKDKLKSKIYPFDSPVEIDYNIKPNKWYHIALTVNKITKFVTLIINNEQKIYQPASLPMLNSLRLGANQDTSHWFYGKLGEIRVWKKAQGIGDIKSNRHKRLSPSEHPNIVAYWPLSEQSGMEASEIKSGKEFKILHNSSTTMVREKVPHNLDSSVDYTHIYKPEQKPEFDIFRLTSNSPSTLSRKLFAGGISELLSIKTQLTKEPPTFIANSPGTLPPDNILYKSDYVRTVPPGIHLDFDGPNGVYYWELFFHAPLMLATRLNTAQQFEEARRWQQFIFNPVAQSDNPWQFLPLRRIPADKGHAKLTDCEWREEFLSGNLENRPTLYFRNSTQAKGFCDKDIPLKGKSFTIEFWAKVDNLTENHLPIIGHGKATGDGKVLHIVISKGQQPSLHFLRFGFWGTGYDLDTPPQTNISGWHHWACVYDSQNKQKRIYCDGGLEKAEPIDGKTYDGDTSPFTIGYVPYGGYDSKCYNGYLAEVRIWSYAKDREQILASWNTPLIGREPGLLCYWPMDEGKGNEAYNYARTGKDIKLSHDASSLAAFRDNPQDPHVLAQPRLAAYMKAVAMRYIDNLLDQGDALFRQYTQESITEAMLYYILADGLLGAKPRNIQPPAPKTQALEDSLSTWTDFQPSATDLLMPDVEKFHVPQNDFFLDYWDRVADRIYKIRNGFNLDGIKQAPPMFGLPLDPAALSRGGALSAGANGTTALNIQVPHYRFSVILAKARDLAARAAQLGGALLSALEKKDAEQLSLLQTSHEAAVLQLARDIKTSQKAEAEASLAALEAGLESAAYRFQHYERLLQKGLSPAETAEIVCMSVAQGMNQIANDFRIRSSVSRLIPDVSVGYPPPNVSASFGGSNLGGALEAIGGYFGGFADALNFGASLSSLIGGFERRAEEWDLQKTLAQHDQAQVEHQITAAQHQCAIAAKDLASLELNIKQNSAIERFLREKFTNAELYHWLANKLAGLHFKTFQMAFDLALATEKAFQFELGSTENFITSAYWDSLKKGLLAGDALLADLDRMEKTYLERNRRRFEIEKNLSLLALAPEALLTLKKTGHCRFALGERLFDQDFPGHYSRQIKRITLTFPAVVGPYQNICATLTQTASHTLLDPNKDGVGFLLKGAPNSTPVPASVRGSWRPIQEVALSRGLNDSGVFELGFYDDRYLPFEGTGAVSNWELEINRDSLNLERLSDVVIKLEYTALQGGGVFKDEVRKLLKQTAWTEACPFDLARDFPEAWESFLSATGGKTLALTPKPEHFKKFSKKPGLDHAKLKGFLLAFDLTEAGREMLKIPLALGTASNPKKSFEIQWVNDRLYQTLTLANPVKEPWKEAWTLTATADAGYGRNNVNNMLLIALYEEGKTA